MPCKTSIGTFVCQRTAKTVADTGKEKDHDVYPYSASAERASSFTSACVKRCVGKGSITLEAALAVPVFFFGILCLVYIMEMMSLQTCLRNALYSAGKEFAQQAYVSPVVSSDAVKNRVIGAAGRERLDRSIIVGGADGIDCSRSGSDWNTAVIDLVVRYDVEIPVLMFHIPVMAREETLRVKGWTGYAEGAYGAGDDEIVYVTEYGSVYHRDLACSYLEVSVTAVDASALASLRNESGGKYYACESCGKNLKPGGKAYVTKYGNRYHSSLDCDKIKRNVRAVLLKDVKGMGGCSKCVK